MTNKEERRFGKQQIIPLLAYTLLLCGICVGYAFGARYELFMQTIDTLWPVIGATLLLIIVILNALLLSVRVPLWLLCALHITGMALLIAYALGVFDEHRHAACCDGPSWQLLLIPLTLSTLPPLLGYALLQFRRRQVQKAAAHSEDALSFQSAADILAASDDARNTPSPNSDTDAGRP